MAHAHRCPDCHRKIKTGYRHRHEHANCHRFKDMK